MNSCGIAAGARKIFTAVQNELDQRSLGIPLKITGCVGMCYREPLLDVVDQDTVITYGEVTSDMVPRIIEQHVVEGEPIKDWIVKKNVYKNGVRRTWDVDGYFDRQQKIVLENSGYIDPENIDEYMAAGGYRALPIALKTSPEHIIATVTDAGLRGRGGAGFPTGLKWKLTRQARDEIKYVVCNADEGDPGAFMDRNVLEGDPHRVVEGMIIGAYAMQVAYGFIYVRAEYPLAIKRLKKALEQAREKGFLGTNILDSGFSFDIKIKEGAGAFVCGEETALIGSIEGKRGMPRPRPPYPTDVGLGGKPTCINNVETWATIPWIVKHGGEAYARIGTEKSKGTKVFALAGKIKRGGNVEVPMGLSLRDILYVIGGGTRTGKPIKAVQLGGPSGGCIPEALFDIPVDYESIKETGAIMGSGGMVVMDDQTCMVDVAKFFLEFSVKESCGKCTFCRLGTKRLWEMLRAITNGQATDELVVQLEQLAVQTSKGSLCGLGQTAPKPVLTTLKYFGSEYQAHVAEKRCPAGVCKSLIEYSIDPESCVGCGACAKQCPVDAITGERQKVHTIDQDVCVKCGNCLDTCRYGAVKVRSAFRSRDNGGDHG
ncbi:MAG: NADH-ubiquinone oxidoreductase-F iron-sulfur binding region domain-containing protein [Thermoplasmatota archaeon]